MLAALQARAAHLTAAGREIRFDDEWGERSNDTRDGLLQPDLAGDDPGGRGARVAPWASQRCVPAGRQYLLVDRSAAGRSPGGREGRPDVRLRRRVLRRLRW